MSSVPNDRPNRPRGESPGPTPLACPYCGGQLTAEHLGGWSPEWVGTECLDCYADWDTKGTPIRVPNAEDIARAASKAIGASTGTDR